MANVLIVSGSYFPNATANAVCVKKFEDALRKAGHVVFYCNRKHDLYEPDYHVYEGTELFTVGKNSDLFFQSLDAIGRLDLPGTMRTDFLKSVFFYRVFSAIHRLGKSKKQLRKEARDHYLHAYASMIARLVQEKAVDLIMSVSMPFDSHMATLKAMELLKNSLKKPNWIAYCIDAYWSKAGVQEKNISWMKEEEKTVFEACDQILFLDTIEKDYSSSEFDFAREKMKSLPLPLFDLQSTREYDGGIASQNGVIDIVYTGTIYDDFRNVNLFVKIAEKLRGEKVRFHFIGKIYSKSLAQLEKLREIAPNQIILYGKTPYDFAKGSMQRADVLLNLANDNTNQIPSKIFEYMACRKPILNLYNVEEDVGFQYLKKYPLALHVYGRDEEGFDVAEFNRWLRESSRAEITFSQLESVYHDVLSTTVSERFIEYVDRILSTENR